MVFQFIILIHVSTYLLTNALLIISLRWTDYRAVLITILITIMIYIIWFISVWCLHYIFIFWKVSIRKNKTIIRVGIYVIVVFLIIFLLSLLKNRACSSLSYQYSSSSLLWCFCLFKIIRMIIICRLIFPFMLILILLRDIWHIDLSNGLRLLTISLYRNKNY